MTYPIQQPFAWQIDSTTTNARRKNTEHMFFHHDDLMTLAEEYRQVCAGETDMSLEDFITKHTIRTRERLIVSLCPRSLLYF